MIIEIFNVCIRKVTQHYYDIFKKICENRGPSFNCYMHIYDHEHEHQ
jgi:hypothetical protein